MMDTVSALYDETMKNCQILSSHTTLMKDCADMFHKSTASSTIETNIGYLSRLGKKGTRIIQPSGEEKYLHKNDAITLRDKSELYLAGSFLPLIFRTNTGDGTILTPYYREDEVEVLKLGG